MPYNRHHVRAFLSASEIELFESSLGTELKSLGAAALKRQLKRTRTLRDKSRDLLQRQKLASRARTGSKLGKSGAANERSVKKAAALDEALTRFEKALAKSEAADARGKSAGQKKDKGSSAAASQRGAKPAKKSPQPTSTPKSPAKKAAAKKVAAKKAVAKPKQRKVPAAVMLRQALQKKQAAEAATTGPGGKASRRRTGPSDGAILPTPPDVRAAAVDSRLDAANLAHIQGHTSTQVRKAQAKRDQRG